MIIHPKDIIYRLFRGNNIYLFRSGIVRFIIQPDRPGWCVIYSEGKNQKLTRLWRVKDVPYLDLVIEVTNIIIANRDLYTYMWKNLKET